MYLTANGSEHATSQEFIDRTDYYRDLGKEDGRNNRKSIAHTIRMPIWNALYRDGYKEGQQQQASSASIVSLFCCADELWSDVECYHNGRVFHDSLEGYLWIEVAASLEAVRDSFYALDEDAACQVHEDREAARQAEQDLKPFQASEAFIATMPFEDVAKHLNNATPECFGALLERHNNRPDPYEATEQQTAFVADLLSRLNALYVAAKACEPQSVDEDWQDAFECLAEAKNDLESILKRVPMSLDELSALEDGES